MVLHTTLSKSKSKGRTLGDIWQQKRAKTGVCAALPRPKVNKSNCKDHYRGTRSASSSKQKTRGTGGKGNGGKAYHSETHSRRKENGEDNFHTSQPFRDANQKSTLAKDKVHSNP